MPGPSDDDLARAVARERVRLRCQLLVDGELASHVLRLRRLRLIGLAAQLSKLSIRRLRLLGLDLDILKSATSSDDT